MNTKIQDNVAPCGLVCYTCTGCNHGIIKELSGQLLQYLDGYEGLVALNWAESLPSVESCMKTLGFWESQNCPGCREANHQCQNKDCVIRYCTREHGIDYCAECSDFPCSKVDENNEFLLYWQAANTRIRDVGAARFFEENKSISQYIRYNNKT